jgi:WhiB family redox-sensing transcriptional regulator
MLQSAVGALQIDHSALESGQKDGVWGGLDEDDRRRMKRRAARNRGRRASA